MLWHSIDIISPKLTWYFKGRHSHTSKISGLISILSIIALIAVSIFFSLDWIRRENPTAYFFNKFVEDAGVFPMNSSSMFHFLQWTDKDNKPGSIDFDSIQIIGHQEQYDTYWEENDLSLYDHWIYGNCSYGDVKGIEELIVFDNFETSACIRHYYSVKEKKYFVTSDPQFIYPTWWHGSSHPNRTFYAIFIEKCRNNPVLGRSNCKGNDEIVQYRKQFPGLAMQWIDMYTDVVNYKQPFTKYFYSITNGIFDKSFATNHLNLNPSTVMTHNGWLFDNVVTDLGYVFDQNEKITSDTNDSGIYCAFYFWMQNRMQIYARSYKRWQDILANIGGFTKLISVASVLMNFVYNKFIVVLDIEKLINELIKSPSKYLRDSGVDRTQISQNYLSNNYVIPNTPSVSNTNIKSNSRPITFITKLNKQHDELSNQSMWYIRSSLTKAMGLNFCKYWLYYIRWTKNRKRIELYEAFRRKICSEEHLFKNHLQVFKLLKLQRMNSKDKNRIDYFDCEIKDLWELM